MIHIRAEGLAKGRQSFTKYNKPLTFHKNMNIDNVLKRLSNGKWEGRRIIDVASEDPKWCKRSAASNLVGQQYKESIQYALEIVEKINYKPEYSIDDPRSLSAHSRVCKECGENTESYIAIDKSADAICFDCYEIINRN